MNYICLGYLLCLYFCILSPVTKFLDNLVILFPAQTIEEHDTCCDDPQDAGDSAESMMHHLLDSVRLLHIRLITSPSHNQGEQRGAQGHANLIGQGDE